MASASTDRATPRRPEAGGASRPLAPAHRARRVTTVNPGNTVTAVTTVNAVTAVSTVHTVTAGYVVYRVTRVYVVYCVNTVHVVDSVNAVDTIRVAAASDSAAERPISPLVRSGLPVRFHQTPICTRAARRRPPNRMIVPSCGLAARTLSERLDKILALPDGEDGTGPIVQRGHVAYRLCRLFAVRPRALRRERGPPDRRRQEGRLVLCPHRREEVQVEAAAGLAPAAEDLPRVRRGAERGVQVLPVRRDEAPADEGVGKGPGSGPPSPTPPRPGRAASGSYDRGGACVGLRAGPPGTSESDHRGTRRARVTLRARRRPVRRGTRARGRRRARPSRRA